MPSYDNGCGRIRNQPPSGTEPSAAQSSLSDTFPTLFPSTTARFVLRWYLFCHLAELRLIVVSARVFNYFRLVDRFPILAQRPCTLASVSEPHVARVSGGVLDNICLCDTFSPQHRFVSGFIASPVFRPHSFSRVRPHGIIEQCRFCSLSDTRAPRQSAGDSW